MQTIKQFLPGLLTLDDAARTATLLRRFIHYINPVVIIYVLATLVIGQTVGTRITLAGIFLLVNVITLYLLRRKRVLLAVLLFIFGAWFIQTLFVVYSGLYLLEVYTYLITVIIAGMLLGTRFGIGVALWCILTVGSLNLLMPNLVLIQPISSVEVWLIFALTMLLIAIIQHLYNQTLRASQQDAQQGQTTQRRFDNIMDILPIGVFQTDAAGQCFYVNQHYLDMLGRSAEAVMGLKWLDAVYADDRARIEREYRKQVDANQTHYEFRVVRPDATVLWIDATTTVERDATGQITGYTGVMVDVTTRKQNEEIHKTSNQYLNTILTASPDFVYVYNLQSQQPILTVEKTFMGYDSGALQDANFVNQHTHPDDIRRVQTYWNNLSTLRRGETHSIEFRLRSVRGHWEWVETRATAITFTPANQPGEILILNTNVTTRKNHERLLQQSEATARDFQKQLKTLHEIGLELSRADTLDDLRRLAVEFALSRLNLTRVSLHCFDHKTNEVYGVFRGETASGVYPIANERHIIQQDKAIAAIHKGQHSIIVDKDVTLYNAKDAVIGKGWRVFAAIWDGNSVLGYLTVENLHPNKALASYELELLTLYGSILGNLCSRKQADDLLRTSEARYRQLFETISDGIGVHDGEVWLDVNPAMTEMYGYTRDEMIGKPFWDFVVPDDRQTAIQHVQNETRSLYEVTSIRKSGELFAIEINAMSITQPDGGLLRVAAVRDLSERKRAAAELAMYSDRMKAILRHLAALSFRIDADGIMNDVHGEALQLMREFDLKKMAGISIFTWLETYRTHVEQALAGDTVFFEAEFPSVFAAVDTHRYYLIHLAFDVQRGSGAVGFVLDVTDIKQAEIRKLEVAIAQERVNLLREFISDASHDLKTPLSIILTKSQLIRTSPDPDRRTYHLDALERQVLHLRRIIDDLLTMSRLDTGLDVVFQSVNIDLVLDEVISELQALIAEKNIQLTTEYLSNCPPILAVESELYRALVNLVENAIHYTPADGSITIRSQMQQDTIAVEIIDTGIGIAAADIDRIFERFYRASDARSVDSGGTGLGLAIVKKVIELHNGDIEVESEPGHGSTFRVILPLTNDS